MRLALPSYCFIFALTGCKIDLLIQPLDNHKECPYNRATTDSYEKSPGVSIQIILYPDKKVKSFAEYLLPKPKIVN
jgi:hypothetical protein